MCWYFQVHTTKWRVAELGMMHIYLKKFLLEVTDNWHADADNTQWTDSTHSWPAVMFVHRFTRVSLVMTEWVIWSVFTLLHAIMKLLLDSQMLLYCRFTALINDCAEGAPSAAQTDMLHGHSSFLQKQWNEAYCTIFTCTFPKSSDKRNYPDKADENYKWL